MMTGDWAMDTDLPPPDDGSGRWLPLRDAVREIGSLEELYRLARDDKLPSREDAAGRIEVWVGDGACLGDASARPLGATGLAVLPGHTGSGDQFAALLGPLTASYERNIELAHEIGTLRERTATMERELQDLRRTAASDKHALEQLRKRLEAVAGENAAPKVRVAERPSRPGRRWLWLLPPGVVVLVALIWASMAAGFVRFPP
jgi:hypothetical protein